MADGNFIITPGRGKTDAGSIIRKTSKGSSAQFTTPMRGGLGLEKGGFGEMHYHKNRSNHGYKGAAVREMRALLLSRCYTGCTKYTLKHFKG